MTTRLVAFVKQRIAVGSSKVRWSSLVKICQPRYVQENNISPWMEVLCIHYDIQSIQTMSQ